MEKDVSCKKKLDKSESIYINWQDFKIKIITRDKEGHCIIKGSIHQEKNYKHICTSKSPKIHEAKEVIELKEK